MIVTVRVPFMDQIDLIENNSRSVETQGGGNLSINSYTKNANMKLKEIVFPWPLGIE